MQHPFWYHDEVNACDRLGMDHVGGAGMPDCVDPLIPRRRAEVKSHARQMTPAALLEIVNDPKYRKIDLTVVALGGARPDTKRLARELGIQLHDRMPSKRVVTARERTTGDQIARGVLGAAVGGLGGSLAAWGIARLFGASDEDARLAAMRGLAGGAGLGAAMLTD